MRCLVDTSVWIDHFRGRLDERKLGWFENALQDNDAILVAPVWLELIVGFRSPAEKAYLADIRAAARWLEPESALWSRAEGLAQSLHKEGIILRMPDLLVLTLAHMEDLKLLHTDQDFDRPLKLKAFSRLRMD